MSELISVISQNPIKHSAHYLWPGRLISILLYFILLSNHGTDIEFLSSRLRVPSTVSPQDGFHWPLASELGGLRAQSQVCHYTVGTQGEKRASAIEARNSNLLQALLLLKLLYRWKCLCFAQSDVGWFFSMYIKPQTRW